MRDLLWIGSSLKELRSFPESVRQEMGYGLYLAQDGGKHPSAKPLRGFGGAGVLELVDDFNGDTYRAIYTVRLQSAVYVLHAFQKKSKRGSETPQREIELIRSRLRDAELLEQRRQGPKE